MDDYSDLDMSQRSNGSAHPLGKGRRPGRPKKGDGASKAKPKAQQPQSLAKEKTAGEETLSDGEEGEEVSEGSDFVRQRSG